jgi:hypothetical protein
MHIAKFLHVNLIANGWYLYCSRGFVPELEKSLYNTFISSAPEVIELEENDVAPVKDKSRGKKILIHASSQVSTCSYTKAFVQRTAASVTTVVGSPTATPSAPLANLVGIPFHRGDIIPLVPHKRKVVATDTSATSSKRSYNFSLIDNVDMEELIEDFMNTKVVATLASSP